MTTKAIHAFLCLSLAVISCTVLGQQPTSKSEDHLETIFKADQLPFVKIADSHYAAVITTDSGESDRFHVFLSNVGNDPNDETLQVMQVVFYLGELPKETSAPVALIKQMNDWNGSLSRGSVFIVGQSIVYQSSDWLFRSDAASFAIEAIVGHYSALRLRKQIEPYLKQ